MLVKISTLVMDDICELFSEFDWRIEQIVQGRSYIRYDMEYL